MLVPSTRLLWITALVLVPTFTVLGMLHVPSGLLVGLAALVGLLAALDAPSASTWLKGVSVELTDTIRVSKGRAFEIDCTLISAAAGIRVLEIGLPFPRELISKEQVLKVTLSPAGQRSEVSWTVEAAERGLFHLQSAFVGCASRLGLWEGRREVPCHCEVRVYPDLTRERHILAPLFLRRGALGMHQVRQLGKGREFEQLRAYLPGDSYEDIFWKGTAKRRFPVTRMYQVERTQEVYVVLDVSRRSARPIEQSAGDGAAAKAGNETQCERFIQAALILALAAEQQGDRFGLIIFSDQTHLLLPAGSGRAHYNAVRDALFTQQPRVVSPDFEDLFISVGNRLRHRSLIIVLTDLGEPWLAESFGEAVKIAARKHVILAHMLGSREFQPLFTRHDGARDADELYEKLAGHIIWHDLQDTARALKQTGVHLTASMEENLVGDVVSEYLKVKKRQLL